MWSFRLMLTVFSFVVFLASLMVFIFWPRDEQAPEPELDEYGRARRSNRETSSSRDIRGSAKALMIVSGILTVVFLVLSCARIVKGTEVAVKVTMGKVSEQPMDRGLHWVAPWTNVERFATTFQVRDIAIPVSGSDGGTMDANVKVRYRIVLKGDNATADDDACSVVELFKTIRSEDRLEELVVDGDTRDVIRTGFRTQPAFLGYTTEQNAIVTEATTRLRARWDRQCVELDNLTVIGLVPSPTVQASIDQALAARQAVDKAEQDKLASAKAADAEAYKKTAAAEAELAAATDLAKANDLLDASLTDNVLRRLYILMLRDTQNQVIYVPSDGDLGLVRDTATAGG